jgi:hypothetical protein
MPIDDRDLRGRRCLDGEGRRIHRNPQQRLTAVQLLLENAEIAQLRLMHRGGNQRRGLVPDPRDMIGRDQDELARH